MHADTMSFAAAEPVEICSQVLKFVSSVKVERLKSLRNIKVRSIDLRNLRNPEIPARVALFQVVWGAVSRLLGYIKLKKKGKIIVLQSFVNSLHCSYTYPSILEINTGDFEFFFLQVGQQDTYSKAESLVNISEYFLTVVLFWDKRVPLCIDIKA